MILTAVLTCVIYHFIALVYKRHQEVSVITGLIQNIIICVTMAVVELLDEDLGINPMLIIYLPFYLVEKGNTATVGWYVLIPHVSLCK